MRVAVSVSRLLTNVAMIVMLLMALHVSASVGLRWVTGRDIPLTLELTASYYMVALTFLPLAAIDLTQSHIRAEFLSSLMGEAANYWLGVVIRVAMFLYLALMTWQTFLNAVDRTRAGDEMITIVGRIIVWPARWIVPFGFLMAAGAALVLILRAVQGRDSEQADLTAPGRKDGA